MNDAVDQGRRRVLTGLAVATAFSILSPFARSAGVDYPFTLGVASGDPLPDGFVSSNCGVRIEHSRCCWLEGSKPNIVVTKRDVITRIFTYNAGLMWFTETVQIVPKTRKTLQTHFSITS